MKTSEGGSTVSLRTPNASASVGGVTTACVVGGGAGVEASGRTGSVRAATCVIGGEGRSFARSCGRERSPRGDGDGAGVGAAARLVEGGAGKVVIAVGGATLAVP